MGTHLKLAGIIAAIVVLVPLSALAQGQGRPFEMNNTMEVNWVFANCDNIQ